MMAGRAFHFVHRHGLPTREHPVPTLAAMIGLEVVGAAALLIWSRRDSWRAPHTIAAAVRGGWTFSVPPGCGAQKLELFGSSADIPKQSEANIRSVSLIPERSNA